MTVYLVMLGNWTHDPSEVFSVWDSREAADREAARQHAREVLAQGHSTRGPEVVAVEINAPSDERVN